MKQHLLIIWTAILAGVYLLGNTTYHLERSNIPELPFEARLEPGNGLRIEAVRDPAVSAGIHRNDRLIEINGYSTVSDRYYLLREQRHAKRNQWVSLLIQSSTDAGRVYRVNLQWEAPQRDFQNVTSRRFFFSLLLPLALAIIALTLHFSRAEGPARSWASFMIISQVLWFPEEPQLLWMPGIREIGYFFNGVFGPLFFLFALGFFTQFPVPMLVEKRWPRAKWFILSTLIVFGLFLVTHSLASIYDFDVYSVTYLYVEPIRTAIQFIWLLCVILISVSQAQLSSTIPPYQQRRRWLIGAGIFAGFLPPAILLFGGQLLGETINSYPSSLVMLAFLFFLAFPISVAVSVIGWERPEQRVSSGLSG